MSTGRSIRWRWRAHGARAIVPVLFLLVAAVNAVAGETGRVIPELFTPDDFGGARRCAGITQDRSGVLYVGNYDSVLTFDGETWRTVPAPIGLAQALRRDGDDRIWVAGVDDFGWLENNAAGAPEFHSLRTTLPRGAWTYGAAIGLEVCSHGVYVIADNALLRRHEGRSTIDVGRRYLSEGGGDLILAQDPGEALMGFDGNRWRALVDTPEIRRKRVTSAVKDADGSWLICTAAEGIWRWRDDRLSSWPTEIDERLRSEPGDHRLDRLRDGNLAVRLWSGGVAVLDPDGHLLQRVTADAQGRPLARGRGFWQDQEGGVWLPTSDGLLRVPWPATFSTFDYASGLSYASVKKVLRHDGHLYAATLLGLYALQPATTDARFVPVPGCGELTWHFDAIGENLVICGAKLRIVNPTQGEPPTVLPLDSFGRRVLPVAGHDDLAVIGTSTGLRLLRRRQSAWTLERILPGFSVGCDELVPGPRGDLWVGTVNDGYHRLPGLLAHLPAVPDVAVDSYPVIAGETMRGLPAIAATEGRIWVGMGRGLFEFDAATRSFRERFRLPPEADGAENRVVGLNGAPHGLVVRTHVTGSTIGVTGRYQFWPVGAKEVFTLPQAVGSSTIDSEEVYAEESAEGLVLWIGGNATIVRAAVDAARLRPRDFRTIIRRIADAHDRLLTADPKLFFRLPAAAEGLRFQWSTDRLDDRRMRYQTWLKGRDRDWSEPSLNATYHLTALAPGDYLLRVRALDQDGRKGAEATFAFAVMPPWWRSGWACAGYVVLLIAGVIEFVRWRGRALLRRNEELETEVTLRTTELRARERQIVEARDAAEAANLAKSVFLASMSHELRTPLNAILGHAQLLRRAPGLERGVRRQLETIKSSGDHLLAMINEVLDLAKVEAGRTELVCEPVALPALLEHLKDAFQSRAEQKGLRFAVECETPLPEGVLADEARLRQVLYNLLGNAVKFTANGRVVLRVSRRDDVTTFAVIDTGPGVRPEHRERIFGLFQQGLTPGTKGDGTGLGLAIGQRLVRLMGDEITVDDAPGGGSCFRFSIPLPVATPPAHSASASGGLPEGYDGPRRRILVVDDAEANRTLLGDLLQPRGFEVEFCDDGPQVFDLVAATKPDLILLDLQLRTLSGLEVVRRLRTRPEGAGLPIVAVSASVFTADRSEAISAGCDEFLDKPVDTAQVCRVIGEYLSLAWRWPPPERPGEPGSWSGGPPADWVPPAMPVLAELERLIRSGDMAALQKRLAGLGGAAESGFVAALAGFAAEARLAELRRWLQEAKLRRVALDES